MAIVDTDQAISKLKNNDVVALPTETVYGLAGSITSEEALKKIFSVKSRPFFDPLIVHVLDLNQAQQFGEWDKVSSSLAKHFWPGPLTIVVRRKQMVSGEQMVSDLITSGGPTVAFRAPDHGEFRAVLEGLGSPLAAPSANRFGHTSPTTAQHVIDEFEAKVSVVDGGASDKGIESTVVEWDDSTKKLKVLRPGVITISQLKDYFEVEKILGDVERVVQDNSPGHLKNHYQPTTSLLLLKNLNSQKDLIAALDFFVVEHDLKFTEWQLPDDGVLAARQLYSDLRQFSKDQEPHYIIEKPEWSTLPQWQGVQDRLEKAAHYIVDGSSEPFTVTTKT